MIRRVLMSSLVAFTLLLIVKPVSSEDELEFDVEQLIGLWEGKGYFQMPVAELRLDVTGEASFKWNEERTHINTSLIAEKFLFSYTDTGQLIYDPATDSITWSIWGNIGGHKVYRGIIDGDAAIGRRKGSHGSYELIARFLHRDTINMRMTVTDKSDKTTERAHLILTRKK